MITSLIFVPISYAGLIIVFLLTILPASIIALPFPKNIRTRISAPFWQAFSVYTIYVATLSQVYKRDERPDEERKGYPKGLYICNHQSFVDVPLVIISVPIPPIMKKEVLYIPVLGICGYSAGAIVVDRKDPDSRRKVFEEAKQRLTSGLRTMMIYPEGTRQRKSDLPKDYAEIKKPILKFAYEKGVPVHSVSVFGTKQVMPSNSISVNFGKKLGIIIRKSRRPEDYQDPESFMKACWQDVVDGHKELQAKLT